MEGDSSSTSMKATKDPGWKYFVQEKQNNKNDLICNFCARVVKGGICRAKQHLVGGFRNVTVCPKCPPNIREEITQYMKKRERMNFERVSNPIFEEVYPLDDDDEDEDGDTPRSSNASVVSKRKRGNIRGPMDFFLMFYVGKLLEARRPHLYWTPCAAHCIDLMLEDIGKEPKIKECFKKAMKVTSYIYTRTGLVNMLRHFTGQRELSRAGITRFATCYLNLEKLHILRENLRTMFTSEDWTESKWSKEVESKKVVSTILSVSFWRNVQYTLKIYAPLVGVLRMVDGERKPPMGYIYEAMDRAKESIISAFNGKEEKYKKAFEIIDNRWNCQLHRPLHAAGYLLNPQFFYAHEGSLDEEVMEGFFGAVERLVPSKDDQNQISIQLSKYRNAEGSFSREMAIRQRQTIYPSLWWENFGSSTPQLQKFAIRVLSLTCSSSGCERNWSVFAHIHSKRRASTDHDKLSELVFVKYNRALQRRYNERDEIDPITLKDIDESNEWLTGRMVDDSDEEPEENDIVFQGESLTWGQVSRAIGADEPAYLTREKGGKSAVPSSSSSRLPSKQVNKGKGKVDDAGKSKGKEKANMNKGKNVRSLLRLVDEDDEYECEGEGSEGELMN